MMVPQPARSRNLELAPVTISASYVRVPDAARVETLTRLDDLVARGAVPPPSHILGGEALIVAWLLTEPVTDDRRERARWLRAQCHLGGRLGVAPSVVPLDLEVPAFVVAGPAVPLDTLLSGATSLPGEHVVDLSPTPTPPGPTTAYAFWLRALVFLLGLAPGKRGAFRRATAKDRAKARALDPAGLGGRLDASDLPRLAKRDVLPWTCPLGHPASLRMHARLGRAVDCEVCAMTWTEREETCSEPQAVRSYIRDTGGQDPSTTVKPDSLARRLRRERGRKRKRPAGPPPDLAAMIERRRAQAREIDSLVARLARLPAEHEAARQEIESRCAAEVAALRTQRDAAWAAGNADEADAFELTIRLTRDECARDLAAVAREYHDDDAAIRRDLDELLDRTEPLCGVRRHRSWARRLPTFAPVEGAKVHYSFSALDTGKTHSIAAAIAAADDVIVVAPLRSLVYSQAARLDLETYDGGDRDGRGARVIDAPKVVTTLDSLPRVLLTGPDGEYRRVDYLVLDESEALFCHFVSETMHDRMGPAYDALRTLARYAKNIVLMDASLGELSVRCLRGLLDRDLDQPAPDEFLLENCWFDAERGVLFHEWAEQVALFLRGLAAGDCSHAACTSKRDAKMLAHLAESVKRPDGSSPRVLLVTSDVEDEAEAETRRDLAARAAEYDVLISSPSLTSGVSIDVRDHFDTVFLFASGADIPAPSLLQMMSRVRNPRSKVAHVSVRSARYSALEDAAEIRAAFERADTWTQLAAWAPHVAYRSGETPDGRPCRKAYDEGLFTLLCEVEAHIARETNCLQSALEGVLRRHGIPFASAPGLEKDARAAVLAEVEAAHESVAAEETARRLARPDMSLREAEDVLASGAALTPRRESAENAVIRHFYGDDDLTSERIIEDENGRRRERLSDLARLLAHQHGQGAMTLDRDIASMSHGLRAMQTTRAYHAACLTTVLGSFGLLDLGNLDHAERWRLDVSGGRVRARTLTRPVAGGPLVEGWVDVTDRVRALAKGSAPADLRKILRRLPADVTPTAFVGLLEAVLERFGIHASVAARKEARALARAEKKKVAVPRALIEGEVEVDGATRKVLALDVSMLRRALEDVRAEYARVTTPRPHMLPRPAAPNPTPSAPAPLALLGPRAEV